MLTSAEIQMIRNADPGAVLPGIDTPTGNPDPASSLMNYTQITQNPAGAPYYYNAAYNQVYVTQNGAVLSGINFGSATVTIDANNVTVEDCTFSGTTSSGPSPKLQPIAGRQSKTAPSRVPGRRPSQISGSPRHKT
jgi:hypothetical protein